MCPSSRIRSGVVDARTALQQGRERIRGLHERGVDSVQVCHRMASLIDEVVLQLFHSGLATLPDQDAERIRSHVCLVANGGYGRRHFAPHSDVDLMILHDGRHQQLVAALAKRITEDVFDTGLRLGHSVRTTSEAIALARQDPQICSSLIESRWLVGHQPLFDSFFESFAKTLQRRASTLATTLIDARGEEQRQFGESVYLLEPNVKKSDGGLRDLQLLRWLWFLRHRVTDPEKLYAQGALGKFDYRRLITARRFLLHVRNELHFHADGPQDTLSRVEQLRIAEKFGYRGRRGLRPVEQFMRDYFHHTHHFSLLAARLCDAYRSTPRVARVLDPVLSQVVDGDYRVGLREISATPQGLAKLTSDLSEVIRLVDLAREKEKRIASDTWATVYRAAPDYDEHISADTIGRFRSLLSRPVGLGEALRRLNELAILEKIIPPFAHARYLLQFNEYHKYTVDEHCIRAVAAATSFAERKDSLGKEYRAIGNKELFHLTLLLHDIGKGRDEDHSVVGRDITEETALRLKFSEADARLAASLVREHLTMSHLTFRRDTTDDDVIIHFTKKVSDPEQLRMLFVLTCADLEAVGPGILNDWKVEVLSEFYYRTARRLAADDSDDDDSADAYRDSLRATLDEKQRSDPWFEDQIEALPPSMWVGREPASIVDMLTRLRPLANRGAVAWGDYVPVTQTVEFTAGVDAGSGRAIFSSMAGALTARGLQILTAEATILAHELLVLRYSVQDPDFADEIPRSRIEEVNDALVAAVDRLDPPNFRTLWNSEHREGQARLAALPDDIRVDNETSRSCTIFEVFACDRRGLLYHLARSLHDQGLLIRFAKIGTYLDQVVDVFYVTDRGGRKLTDDKQIQEISDQLALVIAPTSP